MGKVKVKPASLADHGLAASKRKKRKRKKNNPRKTSSQPSPNFGPRPSNYDLY
jgi:hypothetical protein